MAILDIYIAYIVDWDRFIQVLYLGRAPRTKETLPDFLKWRRVTRPPLVFRRLTGSQRTPGFWGVTSWINKHAYRATVTAAYSLQISRPRLSRDIDPAWIIIAALFGSYCKTREIPISEKRVKS